jgi:secondary thiamine-phosphate synthase enzyme
MRQALSRISVETRGKALYEITNEVREFLSGRGRTGEAFTAGLLTLFCRHTSASLLIQENADPDVAADLLSYFERVAPEHSGRYVHDSEGPDDMPAHLRAALTQTQLSVPIADGRMVLGTWQGIYLFEHRRAPRRREVVVHVIGE